MPPLVLPHDPNWSRAFAEEAAAIRDLFGTARIDLHHIGSTAIPGILAKPIIDLLGAVADLAQADVKTSALAGLGYEPKGAFGIEGRRYFRKIDSRGRRTHHLHVFECGSPQIERHIAFRDYMIAHPDTAADYSSLKARLTRGGPTTWEAYAEGKAPFVRRIEASAVTWARQRAAR